MDEDALSYRTPCYQNSLQKGNLVWFWLIAAGARQFRGDVAARSYGLISEWRSNLGGEIVDAGRRCNRQRASAGWRRSDPSAVAS